MTITCEVCGLPLAGIVCPKCGMISNTPYSCSVCGHPIAAVLCATCAQARVGYYRQPSPSADLSEGCRRAAIIVPISLIALFLLVKILTG